MSATYSLPNHEISPNEPDFDWHESMILSWLDEASGITGIHCVRHRGDTSFVWTGLSTKDGVRFLINDPFVPLKPENTIVGVEHSAGPLAFRAGAEGMELHLEDDDAEVHLTVTDDFEPRMLWGDWHAVQRVAGHLEAGGRVNGRVRVGEETFEIKNALAVHDHSWANANLSYVQSHGTFWGTFGPDLFFSSLVYQAAQPGQDPIWQRGGGVVRNGVHTEAERIDQWWAIEGDGFSARGGEGTFWLPGGEELHITFEALDGFIHDLQGPGERNFTSEFALCRAKLDGSDRLGFGVYEVSSGVGIRREPISTALRASIQPGLSRRERDLGYRSPNGGPGRDGWV